MYEKPGPNCPVVSFELYLSHLNPEFLFQRPRRNASTSEDLWYNNMVVGERTVGQKMKNILREAKLSKCNTNHSIRAIAVTILDKSGFEARHIMAISGHKNEARNRSYSKTGISTKKKLPICKEGIKKLYESTAFDLNDPEKLQNKVFFRQCCTFVAEEGKSSVNSRRLIFHSTRTAPEHATCANQRVN